MAPLERDGLPSLYDFDLHDSFVFDEEELREIREWVASGFDYALQPGSAVVWLVENGYNPFNPAFQIPHDDGGECEYKQLCVPNPNEYFPPDDEIFAMWQDIIQTAEDDDLPILEPLLECIHLDLFGKSEEHWLERWQSIAEITNYFPPHINKGMIPWGYNPKVAKIKAEVPIDIVRQTTLALHKWWYEQSGRQFEKYHDDCTCC